MFSGGVLLFVIEICVIASTVLYHHSDAAGLDELQQVCQRTEDPQLCYKVFNSDRRTPAADMAGLCFISAERTLSRVEDIRTYKIPWLLGKVTDPEVKKSIERYESIYGAAARDFHDAWLSASKKALNDVLKPVLKGANQIIDCENIYKGSPLSYDNQVVIKLTRITVVVLKLLGVT